MSQKIKKWLENLEFSQKIHFFKIPYLKAKKGRKLKQNKRSAKKEAVK
jgi:hypothetical protein